MSEEQQVNIDNIKLILNEHKDILTNIIDDVTKDNIYNVINDLLDQI